MTKVDYIMYKEMLNNMNDVNKENMEWLCKLFGGKNEKNNRININIKMPSLKIVNIEGMIERVAFHNPATIVFWKDGTKTVVKCGEGDTYDKEKGLAMAIIKKLCGNTGSYNDMFKKLIKTDKEISQKVHIDPGTNNTQSAIL